MIGSSELADLASTQLLGIKRVNVAKMAIRLNFRLSNTASSCILQHKGPVTGKPDALNSRLIVKENYRFLWINVNLG